MLLLLLLLLSAAAGVVVEMFFCSFGDNDGDHRYDGARGHDRDDAGNAVTIEAPPVSFAPAGLVSAVDVAVAPLTLLLLLVVVHEPLLKETASRHAQPCVLRRDDRVTTCGLPLACPRPRTEWFTRKLGSTMGAKRS